MPQAITALATASKSTVGKRTAVVAGQAIAPKSTTGDWRRAS
jgi:hypothetical protein